VLASAPKLRVCTLPVKFSGLACGRLSSRPFATGLVSAESPTPRCGHPMSFWNLRTLTYNGEPPCEAYQLPSNVRSAANRRYIALVPNVHQLQTCSAYSTISLPRGVAFFAGRLRSPWDRYPHHVCRASLFYGQRPRAPNTRDGNEQSKVPSHQRGPGAIAMEAVQCPCPRLARISFRRKRKTTHNPNFWKREEHGSRRTVTSSSTSSSPSRTTLNLKCLKSAPHSHLLP